MRNNIKFSIFLLAQLTEKYIRTGLIINEKDDNDGNHNNNNNIVINMPQKKGTKYLISINPLNDVS